MIRRHFRTLLGVYTQRQRIAFAAKILLWSGTAVLLLLLSGTLGRKILLLCSEYGEAPVQIPPYCKQGFPGGGLFLLSSLRAGSALLPPPSAAAGCSAGDSFTAVFLPSVFSDDRYGEEAPVFYRRLAVAFRFRLRTHVCSG